MSRDCVNPDQFDPERHLLPTGELSPTARMSGSLFFGFGRRCTAWKFVILFAEQAHRICPGRFFAEGVLWAAVVHILATLRFSKDKDANGRYIEIDPVFTNGVTS